MIKTFNTIQFTGKPQQGNVPRRFSKFSMRKNKASDSTQTYSTHSQRAKKPSLKKRIGIGFIGLSTFLGVINIFPVRPLPDCISSPTTIVVDTTEPTPAITHSDPYQESDSPRQQRISSVLEALLPGPYQSPYDVNQGLGVINGILFDVTQPHLNNEDSLEQLETMIENNTLPAEQQRQLEIATQLNEIILLNSHQRGPAQNDAEAFSEALAVVIEANTTHTDDRLVVCQHQLVDDLKLFFINQNHGWLVDKFSEFEESPTAIYLFGGSRVGTTGWQENLRDRGQLTNANGQPINQAHHLVAFLIEGLKKDGVLDVSPYAKAWILDGGLYAERNQPDIDLGYVGTRLGQQLRSGDLTWHELPQALLDDIALPA